MIPLMFYVVILLTLLIVYVVKNSPRRPKNFPPGPVSLPLWGTYWLLLKEDYFLLHKAVKTYADRYNTDLIGFQLGPNNFISCQTLSLCKEVLNRDEFIGRPVEAFAAKMRSKLSPKGLFFTEGTYWHDQRRFSLRHLRDFGFGRRDFNIEEVASHEIRKLIEFLTSKPKISDSDVCTTQGVVLVPDVLYGPAINSIHYSISATNFDNYRELRDIGRHAVNYLRSFDGTGGAVGITNWLRYLAPDHFGYTSAVEDNKVLLTFALRIIKDHQDSFCEEHHRDFIDVYLSQMKKFEENNELDTSFSINQLQYLITDYMFPSPVGTGHTFNFLLGYFLHYPELQANIQKEIDSVIGRARLPGLDDRKNLSYTEAVLRECMRKDPIVPLGVPRKSTVDTTLAGYDIPKDTVVIPNLWAAHNDVKVWGDPENFRPERWLDADGVLLRKDISIPFGAGKRLCAGETFARNTMFLFLAGLMQNFTFKVPQGMPLPDLNKNTFGLTTTLPAYYVEAVPR